jgi:hypothetical protein
MLYGVNVNFLHYLNNNMSPRQKKEDLSRKQSIAPWFFQIAMGPTLYKPRDIDGDNGLSNSDKIGEEVSVSLGKWFSSAVGMRATFSTSTVSWQRVNTDAVPSTNKPSYSRLYYTSNAAFRMEAMINPLGFVRNYNWDKKFGFYLFGGLGLNHTVRYGTDNYQLRVVSQMYSGGLHLFARLQDGLHLFIEPRYSKVVYRIPYRGVDKSRIFEDDYYTLNIGLSASIMPEYGKNNIEGNNDHADIDNSVGLTFGVAGMIPFAQYKGSGYDMQKGQNIGGKVFVQYRLGNESPFSARIGLEYLKLNTASVSIFNDIVVQGGESVVRKRSGMFSFSNSIMIATAACSFNIPRLFLGQARRHGRFDAETFFGVGVAMHTSAKPELYEGERLLEGHTWSLVTEPQRKSAFVLTLGMKLSYAVSRHIGIYAEPQMYFVEKLKLPGRTFTGVGKLNSIALGVQYGL